MICNLQSTLVEWGAMSIDRLTNWALKIPVGIIFLPPVCGYDFKIGA